MRRRKLLLLAVAVPTALPQEAHKGPEHYDKSRKIRDDDNYHCAWIQPAFQQYL
jgi:hypothetical protein